MRLLGNILRLVHSVCSLLGNRIGDEGASALAAILKETKITDLKCAAAPECSLSCQRPLTRACSLTAPTHPLQSRIQPLRSRGVTALAAVLKNTEITNLECAAVPQGVLFSVSAR